ncbi:hypothetical protein ABT112_26770 [Streptomyces sp. NPDC002055]|uniref:hypothetical protein n=1 Tax=Streptomyces sp. NPDC002055 TaxID=3154534 RepID=UPI00332D6DD5
MPDSPDHTAPLTPNNLDLGDAMLGDTFTITPDEMRAIFARLQPHLPPYLRKIEPHESGWGMRYEFATFTGREEEPAKPSSYYDDPQLRYVRESENAAEHQLRLKATHILTDLYDRACDQWKDAAYVADLKAALRDAPSRWRAYEQARKALEAANGYLRTPQAAAEWPSAISRLVDAQEQALAAAVAFDERAEDIAKVHDRHVYAELGSDAAYTKAGCPEAKDWHITDADHYCHSYRGYHSSLHYAPLAETVRALIEQQDAHLAKVGRLSGTTAD